MTPYEFQGPVTNTGKFVTDFLINPLGIPREQTLEQLESFLKRLASDEGFAILQRRLFLACMCLVAGLAVLFCQALAYARMCSDHVCRPLPSCLAIGTCTKRLGRFGWALSSVKHLFSGRSLALLF